MAQPEMSFAQALNEAKGVIVQLSTRVKGDAEKIRSLQQTIASQQGTIVEHEAQIVELATRHEGESRAQADRHAGELQEMAGKIKEVESASAHADAILNRQGERILSLEAANADLEARISDLKAQIVAISRERDSVKAQLPSDEDSAALASMAQLLIKAAPAIEKAKKSSGLRIADGSGDAIAEAA